MGSHWPIAFAVLLVALAGGYGYYQGELLKEAGEVKSNVRKLPDVYIPTSDASVPVRAPATMMPVAVQPSPVQPAVAGNSGMASQNPNPALPAKPMMPGQPAAQAPVVVAQPGQLTPISPGSVRGAVFTALRTALVQKFGAPPMPAQNGGFAVAVDGVRVEVDPNSDWSVAIYNNNPANAAMQTENFKSALNLTIATLEIDMTAQPITAADGKQTLRTSSKLNRISMITDPAMGNSVTIKPIQKKTLVTPQNATNPQPPAVQNPAGQAPALPGPPQTKKVRPETAPVNPVTPPKPPANDQF